MSRPDTKRTASRPGRAWAAGRALLDFTPRDRFKIVAAQARGYRSPEVAAEIPTRPTRRSKPGRARCPCGAWPR
eukprot:10062770-Alexandrium_andersonii.AAC.1